MSTKQPKWKYLANLGDTNPIEYGGYFVYTDTTGVYGAEAELLLAPEADVRHWEVFRFCLDQCKLVECPDSHRLYLVPVRYAADWPHALAAYDEWFHDDLASVAETCGQSFEELRAMFCSDNPIDRAQAYRMLGECHGYANLDAYPLMFAKRSEVTRRYRSALRKR